MGYTHTKGYARQRLMATKPDGCEPEVAHAYRQKERICMISGCGKKFVSQHNGDRFCSRCRDGVAVRGKEISGLSLTGNRRKRWGEK